MQVFSVFVDRTPVCCPLCRQLKRSTQWNYLKLITLLMSRNTGKSTSNLYSVWVCQMCTVQNLCDTVFHHIRCQKQLDSKLRHQVAILSRFCLVSHLKSMLFRRKRYSHLTRNTKSCINLLHRKLELHSVLDQGFLISIMRAPLDSIKDLRLWIWRNETERMEKNMLILYELFFGVSFYGIFS